jgi:hypothetical protein
MSFNRVNEYAHMFVTKVTPPSIERVVIALCSFGVALVHRR